MRMGEKAKSVAKTGLLLTAFTLTTGLPSVALPGAIPLQDTTTDPSKTLQYANALHLAYVISPSTSVNSESYSGLNNLSNALTIRTSVEPAGVAALDIEKDDLAFFPFIYWPVTQDTPKLSDDALKKVQKYIDSGGVIVFDLHSGVSGNLRNIIGDIHVKPMQPMNEKHTLTKSFYLTSGLPGSYNYEEVWVEMPGPKGSGNLSSVIIAERNWAGAWAGSTVANGSKEAEDAIRAGINMVMYALTGNYKSDQLHTPSILKRLEKK